MKSRLNWRYVNVLVLLLIIYMLYVLSPLWGNLFEKAVMALLPILIAFAIAFVFNPIVTLLEQKAKIPRVIAILFLYAFIISLVLVIIFVFVKPYIEDLGNLTIGITNLLVQIGEVLNIDTSSVQQSLTAMVNDIYNNVFSFFTATGEGANLVVGAIFGGAVIVIVGIIFLINFENIKNRTKEYLLLRESKKMYLYVSQLYHDLTNYLVAEIIIATIQFVEYAGLFLLIGIFIPEYMNYALVLGVCVAVFSLVPYFGGYLSSFFMILIALSLPGALYAAIPIGLFILIFPNLDAYLINPHIYKKQLKLNPLLSVSAILLAQAFFGLIGVFISIPAILFITITYNFYKDPIKAKIRQFKESL